MRESKRKVFLGIGAIFLLGLVLAAIWLRSPRPASPLPTPTEVKGGATPLPEEPAEEAAFTERRLRMVEQTIVARGVKNPDVIAAMKAVPRHLFVPEEYLDFAYNDHPLPIGFGQTISQPYIVAWMTELADLKPDERVLEIGTGSGYQAAILAQLGYLEVYSIEIIPELAEGAAERLRALGYKVEVRQGDGYYGWPEAAPFDAIIVTAAPDHLPAPLVAQLKEGGRIIIPIGPPGSYQTLWKFVKQNGELTAYELGGVAFVPLTGEGVQRGAPSPAP
ncbi:MAG: protein-L-isoaspartate(D-aspartate) O-methyltransferase [Anaerolineales bacterium]|nr:protein-L-isoaspartate(D-aspartate) O-methyltransferase [Anaerolineales bacterium]MCS7247674.1 protein-L-isoaspartate(D-aspartate) O-methyltransferase [Anaerolineales bacterium]MDW8161484.1 protein-L-isoaspartate(D-aspartate) O-methyltransferase [Anaerolineales bacterium]MDW8446883.1 protein-L-isoaspartate(D-aspartate) O-methyltransferase [Anaerolineales bacterium]